MIAASFVAYLFRGGGLIFLGLLVPSGTLVLSGLSREESFDCVECGSEFETEDLQEGGAVECPDCEKKYMLIDGAMYDYDEIKENVIGEGLKEKDQSDDQV